MYAIGVKSGAKVSACIVNTVMQVANNPNMISVSMSHNNFSNECIRKTGLFTVSVLSEDTSGAVIGALGFSSGRDADKLKNVNYRVLAEGVPVVRENICCWFLCKVVGSAETRTHTVFSGGSDCRQRFRKRQADDLRILSSCYQRPRTEKCTDLSGRETEEGDKCGKLGLHHLRICLQRSIRSI